MFRYSKMRPFALESMTSGAIGALSAEGFSFSRIGMKPVKCACAGLSLISLVILRMKTRVNLPS